jgi:hypothetical protein
VLLLITFGVSELIEVLGLVVILGVAWYTFRSQAPKVWRDVADGLTKKVAALEEQIGDCEAEHERCNRKVNKLTAFNLRMQAREKKYQSTINRLEHSNGLQITDWSDGSEAPEDSDFG